MVAGATGAARRSSPRGSSANPVFGGTARRGREIPHNKASAHRAARRIRSDTDPDTIDDEKVREAFIDQRMADLDDEESGRSGRGRRMRDAAGDAALSGRDSAIAGAQRSAASGARRVGGTADDAGGVFLGMIGAALVINYLRAGWPGVTAWARAKFKNETSSINNAGQVTPTGAGAAAGKSGKKKSANPLSPGALLKDVEHSPAGIVLNPVGAVSDALGSL